MLVHKTNNKNISFIDQFEVLFYNLMVEL